jgi:hypothetical protein
MEKRSKAGFANLDRLIRQSRDRYARLEPFAREPTAKAKARKKFAPNVPSAPGADRPVGNAVETKRPACPA